MSEKFGIEEDKRLANLDAASSAAALLSAQAFLIETLIASMFAQLSPSQAAAVGSILAKGWDRSYGKILVPDHADIATTARHFDAVAAFVERLVRNAQRRADGVRAARRSASGGPAA
jgi:hypothetical protein